MWMRTILIVLLLLVGMPFRVFASLGGSLDSVKDDQVQLQAKRTVIVAGAYVVHELTTPTGMVVREYVSRTGSVFAVTWKGPFVPDMRQLLGTYFAEYSQAARSQQERHPGRLPLNIHEAGFVVQTSGHMRAYTGRASVSGLFPAGVTDYDIR
jgi:hypothetical protein